MNKLFLSTSRRFTLPFTLSGYRYRKPYNFHSPFVKKVSLCNQLSYKTSDLRSQSLAFDRHVTQFLCYAKKNPPTSCSSIPTLTPFRRCYLNLSRCQRSPFFRAQAKGSLSLNKCHGVLPFHPFRSRDTRSKLKSSLKNTEGPVSDEEAVIPAQKQDLPKSRTIVITSGKGGVGKTTATANLGMSIARLGYRVALIDSDIGLRNLDLLLGLENRIMYTAMDILEGQCRLDQALIRDKRWKNLSLLAISKNRQRYNVTRKNMENLVTSISSSGYHFILIDCPAGIDVGFINAISPAEEALIVTTPEITAIRDADRVAGLLEANGIFNTKLLVNRVRPDMVQRNDMMSVRDVQEMLGIPLLGVIPEDHHVIISTNRGEPLVLKKKLTLSGIAFENAARRLIGKQDYFIDLSSPYKGLFQKVQEIVFGL